MILGIAVISCNSNGNDSASEDTTGVNMPGIENVNGNIPDTSNSITIDDTTTSSKDTLK